jgi:hypothetical protein
MVLSTQIVRTGTSLLEAALVGNPAERQRIEMAIADIQNRLGRIGTRQRSSDRTAKSQEAAPDLC